MPITLKAQEARVRRLARREGYRVCKSRDRSTHINNRGEYMLVETARNLVVLGSDYDASLANIEAFLADAA